jgi:hypothetical protein
MEYQRGKWRVKSQKKERTDDTNLEVIARATKERFLLLRRRLFWRHPLFDGGERYKGERKGSRGRRRAREQSQSMMPHHFLKGRSARRVLRLPHAHLSAQQRRLLPMKSFGALFTLSLITSVLAQQLITTTNAYVFLHTSAPLPLNPIKGRQHHNRAGYH